MLASSQRPSNFNIILAPVSVLLFAGFVVLRSLTGTDVYGYTVFFLVALMCFIIFSKVDFEIFLAFSKYFYILSIVLLLFNLLLGYTTRGVIRWIPIGGYSFQPSEIVRPFLFLYLSQLAYNASDQKHAVFRLILWSAFPVVLIVLQPSLGVALLTLFGAFGVIISSRIDKKFLLYLLAGSLVFLPLFFLLLRPYQRERLTTFVNPWESPTGAGYNSVQSMISVGSGRLFGRGLGEGVGTNLRFLPENNTDFIFASISEELGFIGSITVLLSFFFYFRIILGIFADLKYSPGKIFVSATFLSLFVQTAVNIGMNLGMVPITGVPLPFVSEGGSSLISTSIATGMLISASKKRELF